MGSAVAALQQRKDTDGLASCSHLPCCLQVSAVLSNRQQMLQELADDLDKAIVSV
jgi:hypothetical protein